MGIISTRCESLLSTNGKHEPETAVEGRHWFTDVSVVKTPEGQVCAMGTRNALMVVFCRHCGILFEDYKVTSPNQIVE